MRRLERLQRKAANVAAKLERMRQVEEGHRCRVLADRKRLDLHDALHRVGCSPGERTFTNDWAFWHGYEVEKETESCAKIKLMKKAKNGENCGGSQEWVCILRQRRARANRRAQEENISRRREKLRQFEVEKKVNSSCFEAPSKPSVMAIHPLSNKRRVKNVSEAIQKPCRKTQAEKVHGQNQRSVQAKILFDAAPKKCLQQAILALAQNTCENVYAVLLRMLRASCGNASPSGFGYGRQSEANLYATQHALRYIGAYVL